MRSSSSGRASWPDERIIRGTLATIATEVATQPIERTALILVGKVLSARDFRNSALYDAEMTARLFCTVVNRFRSVYES